MVFSKGENAKARGLLEKVSTTPYASQKATAETMIEAEAGY